MKSQQRMLCMATPVTLSTASPAALYWTHHDPPISRLMSMQTHKPPRHCQSAALPSALRPDLGKTQRAPSKGGRGRAIYWLSAGPTWGSVFLGPNSEYLCEPKVNPTVDTQNLRCCSTFGLPSGARSRPSRCSAVAGLLSDTPLGANLGGGGGGGWLLKNESFPTCLSLIYVYHPF